MIRAFLEMELRAHLRRAAEIEEQLREMDMVEIPGDSNRVLRVLRLEVAMDVNLDEDPE